MLSSARARSLYAPNNHREFYVFQRKAFEEKAAEARGCARVSLRGRNNL